MWEALLLYALAEFVFSLTPGPAVFLVITQSIQRGFSAGMSVTFGIVSVNILYFGLSALGVGAALAASPEVFKMLKYAGAAYLAYCALSVLYELYREQPIEIPEHKPVIDARRTFIQGFLLQASNIKNIVIFVAIIPQFIDPSYNTTIQFVGLGVVSILVETPILIGYTLAAVHIGQMVKSKGYTTYLEVASSMILLGIAGSLAVI